VIHTLEHTQQLDQSTTAHFDTVAARSTCRTDLQPAVTLPFANMAAAHLVQFSSLPRELRDQIWDAAIRPNRPAAHTFSVVLNHHLNVSGLTSAYAIKEKPIDGGHFEVNRLMAPTKISNTEYSWTIDNDSAYLIDSGLWTACKESRHAMRRRFRPGDWQPIRRAFREQDIKGISPFRSSLSKAPDAPVTAGFESNGEYQTLTVLPKSDLFILRPVKTEEGHGLDNLSYCCNLLTSRSGSMVTNIAFELPENYDHERDVVYKRENADGEPTTIMRVMACYASELIEFGNTWFIAPKVWFIDPSQSRCRRARDGAREVFYSSGRTYVEVTKEEGSFAAMEILEDVQRIAKREIRSQYPVESPREYDWEPDWEPDITFEDPDFKVRILAIEEE
jgi:hypothetical protein